MHRHTVPKRVGVGPEIERVWRNPKNAHRCCAAQSVNPMTESEHGLLDIHRALIRPPPACSRLPKVAEITWRHERPIGPPTRIKQCIWKRRGKFRASTNSSGINRLEYLLWCECVCKRFGRPLSSSCLFSGWFGLDLFYFTY